MSMKTHTSLESFMVGVNKYVHLSKYSDVTMAKLFHETSESQRLKSLFLVHLRKQRLIKYILMRLPTASTLKILLLFEVGVGEVTNPQPSRKVYYLDNSISVLSETGCSCSWSCFS